MHRALLPFARHIPFEHLERVVRTWEAAGLSARSGENIIAHSVRVAAVAWTLPDMIHLFPEDRLRSATAALLHDALKLRQVGVLAHDPHDLDAVGDVADEQIGFLLAHGWPWHIVEAASAAGHEILPAFLRRASTISDLRKVVFFSDLLAANGGFVMIEERIAYARQRYPGIDERGQEFYRLPDRTYTVLQQVGSRLQAHFARRAGFADQQDFHRALVSRAGAFLGD